jgi:hypothetical protein
MRVPLIGGYYEARSLIAASQRCANLYPEANPQGSPAPFSDYPTPGLTPLGMPPVSGPARGLWNASDGSGLYYVCGSNVYFVSSSYTFTQIGSIGYGTTPVAMQDNGTGGTLFIADGTNTGGWTINLASQVMAPIVSAAWQGATRLDFIDTYLVGNIPNSATFFSSDSNAATFDPLFEANKSGAPDQLASVAVYDRNILLLGTTSGELWFDAGNANFPFQLMSGPFLQVGTSAPYSVARQGSTVFFVGQDQFGGRMIMKVAGYKADKISTHAIDNELMKYSTVADAVGFCYQQGGHQFYMLSFPTANKTWCFDIATGLWHERFYTDSDGNENRHRAQCGAYAYGLNIVGDWETGQLYSLDINNYADNGSPIIRVRDFPHMVEDGARVVYRVIDLDMECGTSADNTTSGAPYQQIEDNNGNIFGLVVGPALESNAPQVQLSWSDDRGATFGNSLFGSMGATGETLTNIQFRRCGMARDRVFRIRWSEPVKTSLQGAWVTSKKAAT